jgi:hypothetical protein
MLISSILEAHEDHTLPRNERIINDVNVGDAFLYRHHAIYRNLRDCYWAFGYRFDTRDFCYLFELPLFSLNLILGARRLPVRDTVSPLRDLTRRFPGAVFNDLSFSSELAYPINHILHHSVHCIADHVTAELIGTQEKLGQTPLAVLRILLCESFGNAIDLLSRDVHHEQPGLQTGRGVCALRGVGRARGIQDRAADRRVVLSVPEFARGIDRCCISTRCFSFLRHRP